MRCMENMSYVRAQHGHSMHAHDVAACFRFECLALLCFNRIRTPMPQARFEVSITQLPETIDVSSYMTA